jgi:signal peptidase I
MKTVIPNGVSTSDKNETSKRSAILEWARFILLMAAIAIMIPFSTGITKVSGMSMFPTLTDGNILLEEKISKYFSSPEIGDVIIINKENLGYKVVKRVIGAEGDSVEIKDGIVYVNNQAIPEIMTNGTSKDMEMVMVPKGHIFLMGDNRVAGESIDSRDSKFGTVNVSEIDGYALFSLSPFQSIAKPIEME